MPRVNHVAKCRQSPGKCGKCGKEIIQGEPYVWWKFRYGGKRIRCAKPGCGPKPSDLTQSEFLSQLYDLQERDFSGAETIDDLESMREDVKGELETLRDEQEEKRSNMPDSLQESDTGNLLQERYDALDEAINELDGVDLSLEEEEPEEVEDPGAEPPKREASEDDATYTKRVEEWTEKKKAFDDYLSAHEEWEDTTRQKLDDLAEELASALQNISCG